MIGTYRTLKAWTVAFENAAWALLADLAQGRNGDSYHVRAEPCPKHDPGCVCVVYGALLDHVEWLDHDPEELAARLVGTMLPRA